MEEHTNAHEKKRQPVQIDEDIMKQLRELSGGPKRTTRHPSSCAVACEAYLNNHPLRHEAARKILKQMKADGTPVRLLNPWDRKTMRALKKSTALLDRANKLKKRREALATK